MSKQQIIRSISETVRFCIADGNTYLYAKCVPTVREDDKKMPIGGGNFTILLSTLATIEFLGTIDAILEGESGDFWSAEEVRQLKEAKKQLKKACTACEKYFSSIRLPKSGELKKGSGECLQVFLAATQHITGITDDLIEEIRRIRNKLAHEFTPKIRSALGIDFVPSTDFVSLVLLYDQRDVACMSSDNEIGIDSNALNRKLEKLLGYVTVKLNKTSEESDSIKKIGEYIERQQ